MGGAIVIPAAGASRRMGCEDKLLRPVCGVPLIRRTALHALASGQTVQVTLRPQDQARRAALAGLAVEILEITDAAEGMAASLRRAAVAIGSISSLMILPADMPEVAAEDLARMWRTHSAHPDRIVQAMSGDAPGHPIILPGDLLPELRALSGDIGVRPILQRQRHRILPVPLYGRRAILDLDTPQDFADWAASRPSPDPEAEIAADPLAAALADPRDCVLAVITAVYGTSWRSQGAIMGLWRDGRMVGQLTGGCIEADLALHMEDVLNRGRPESLRYGVGSPFFDIRLPCGGTLDILLFPVRDTRALSDMACLDQGRVRAGLRFRSDGTLGLELSPRTGWQGQDFVMARDPEVQFLVFGQGEDARVFDHIARAAGYSVVIASAETPKAEDILLLADARTAVLTFSHDHERDAAILAAALRSPAPYVGALGSPRVAARRLALLRAAGLNDARLARLHSPVGLIPSTRDPRGLALSILAEIVALDLASHAQSAGSSVAPMGARRRPRSANHLDDLFAAPQASARNSGKTYPGSDPWT